MIEIRYPYYVDGAKDGPLDEGQHVEDCIVSSGVVVDVAVVQAIRIHTKRVEPTQAVLQITMQGGATVDVPLYCLDSTLRYSHARTCLHWVRRQIEHVRGDAP